MDTSETRLTAGDVLELRTFLGMTQQTFAGLLGVHPITVSKWERGVAQPPPYNLKQMWCLKGNMENIVPAVIETAKRYCAENNQIMALAALVL